MAVQLAEEKAKYAEEVAMARMERKLVSRYGSLRLPILPMVS